MLMAKYSPVVKMFYKFCTVDVRVLVHKLLQAGPWAWHLQMSCNKLSTSAQAQPSALGLNASLKVPALISTLFSQL